MIYCLSFDKLTELCQALPHQQAAHVVAVVFFLFCYVFAVDECVWINLWRRCKWPQRNKLFIIHLNVAFENQKYQKISLQTQMICINLRLQINANL